MKIGANLKSYRLRKKLTIVDVAKKLGVSIGSISFWENDVNEPRRALRKKLCKLYDITDNELFGINRLIPVVGYASANGGFVNNTEGKEFFGDMININFEKIQGVVIKGDSMSPYRDGDVVMYNPEVEVESGDPVYIKLKSNKGIFFKMFYDPSAEKHRDNFTEGYQNEIAKLAKRRKEDNCVILFSTTDTHHPLFIIKNDIEFVYKVVGVLFASR